MTPQNKNYSDWLVVSDIDGTLNNKFRRFPKRNRDAINRFVYALGGNFTLASGRNEPSLMPHYKKLPINSVPAIVSNGAGIYDFLKNKMIFFSPINSVGADIVMKTAELFPHADAVISSIDKLLVVGKGIYGRMIPRADKLKYEYHRGFDTIKKDDWGKVVFVGPPPVISKVGKYLTDLGSDEVTLMDTSPASFEVLNKNTNKGTAVLRLADMMGIDRSHTAAIGDYYNDLDMIKAVGVSACCGQAPGALRDAADFTACHCNKGAVADLLEYIEKNY